MRPSLPFAVFGLTAAWPGVAAAADPQPLDQVAIRLFEQAEGALLPVARRIYTTHFDATRTRVLGVEISAMHPAYEATQQIPVACAMQKPDGSEIASDQTINFELAAGATQSSNTGLLFGVADEEDWQPGDYGIRCLADDQVIAQTQFKVVLNPADIADAEIRVAGLRLFPVERELPARADRSYASALAAAETRHIGIELEFTHTPLGQTLTIPVECYFFWPDGQTSQPVLLRYEPQATWSGGYSAGALGWDQAGNWLPGVYTVTCMIGGRPVIVDRFDLT